jgi:ABC-type glutathione transport system ATPase component
MYNECRETMTAAAQLQFLNHMYNECRETLTAAAQLQFLNHMYNECGETLTAAAQLQLLKHIYNEYRQTLTAAAQLQFLNHIYNECRETLTTAAQLQMGPDTAPEAVCKVVDSLIEKLGLKKAADTIVGNAKVRGLSGGERKRLSIACELLGNPSLLFCDEPTTGLDSFQAEQVRSITGIMLNSISGIAIVRDADQQISKLAQHNYVVT